MIPDVSNHPIHPWYGPCDGLADGECFECRKTFDALKVEAEQRGRLIGLREARRIATKNVDVLDLTTGARSVQGTPSTIIMEMDMLISTLEKEAQEGKG